MTSKQLPSVRDIFENHGDQMAGLLMEATFLGYCGDRLTEAREAVVLWSAYCQNGGGPKTLIYRADFLAVELDRMTMNKKKGRTVSEALNILGQYWNDRQFLNVILNGVPVVEQLRDNKAVDSEEH